MLCFTNKNKFGVSVHTTDTSAKALPSATNHLVTLTVPRSARNMEKLAPSKRHQFVHKGQLVYEWDQTVDDVNLYVQTPPGLKASMLRCDIQSRRVTIGVKGDKPYLDVRAICHTRLRIPG